MKLYYRHYIVFVVLKEQAKLWLNFRSIVDIVLNAEHNLTLLILNVHSFAPSLCPRQFELYWSRCEIFVYIE